MLKILIQIDWVIGNWSWVIGNWLYSQRTGGYDVLNSSKPKIDALSARP